jgi:uncharacterized membrane protein HdeD (DUF308 family)
MSEPRPAIASITQGTHFLGLSLIGLGILSALAPAIAGAPVIILVGLLVTIAGIVRGVFGWRAWSEGKGPMGLVVGGLAIACGLALALNPVSTLGAVSSLVAVYMVVDGISALLFSLRLDESEGRAWMLGDALLSVGLGVSMWVGWPLSGLRALGILIGVKLASAGAVLLRVEQAMRRLGAGVAALRSPAGG